MRTRPLLEAVIATGFALTLLTAPADPAHATPDGPGGARLSVTAVGGTIAADSPGKAMTVKVRNSSAVPVPDLQVTYDLSGLTALIPAAAPLDQIGQPRPCTSTPDRKLICSYADHVVQPWENFDFGLTATNSRTGSGDGGVVRISVSSALDTTPADNSTRLALRVGGHGGDLLVLADDVFAADPATGYNNGSPLAPGETSSLWLGLFNQGDRRLTGFGYTLRLPEHVTFVSATDGCSLSADRRLMNCAFPDRVLVPLIEADGQNVPGFNLRFLVTADARSSGSGLRPTGWSVAWPQPTRPAQSLVEPADDIDTFAVHVTHG
ncbi:hypothetical protein ACVMYR_28935 [Micromonospora sp. PTRAS2]